MEEVLHFEQNAWHNLPILTLKGEKMFHEYRDKISKLKQENAHFAKIFDAHNELDQKIKNMEAGIEIATNDAIQEYKKEKLQLKDEIYSMLKN